MSDLIKKESVTSGLIGALKRDLKPKVVKVEKKSRGPEQLFLLADASGSMYGKKWDALLDAIEVLKQHLATSVMKKGFFSNSLIVIESEEEQREMKPSGGTSMMLALQGVVVEFPETTRIILITDGQPSDASTLEIINFVSAAGITIDTVDIGYDCDTYFLKEVARVTDGKYYSCDLGNLAGLCQILLELSPERRFITHG